MGGDNGVHGYSKLRTGCGLVALTETCGGNKCAAQGRACGAKCCAIGDRVGHRHRSIQYLYTPSSRATLEFPRNVQPVPQELQLFFFFCVLPLPTCSNEHYFVSHAFAALHTLTMHDLWSVSTLFPHRTVWGSTSQGTIQRVLPLPERRRLCFTTRS